MTKTKRNKQHEKVLRDLLKELPYFNCRRNLGDFHGRFNNLLQSNIRSKRYLDKLTSLYELDLSQRLLLSGALGCLLITHFITPS